MMNEFVPVLSWYRQTNQCGKFSLAIDCFDWCHLETEHDEDHAYQPTTRKERRMRKRQIKRELYG